MSQEGDYLLSVSPESLARQPVDATTGENLHWTCDPTVELPIKISRDPKNNGSATPITTMNLMERNIVECPDFPALRVKRNGAWKTWTWAQYDQDVRRFARAAIRVGLQAHQCICIIGFNSPEWVIASIGAIFAGGISSGIYTTNGIEATHYVASHSESVIAVAEDSEQVAKFLASRDRLPHLKQIVQYSGDILPENKKDGFVISWSDFLASGDIDAYPEGEQLLKQRIDAQRPGHCCSLIYTSGTTGKPKAVMLSHDNFTWTISYCLQEVNISRDERLISYLPLSHVAAQLVDIYGTLFSQGCLSFAMPDALKGTLVQTLQEVRPTIFVGVPRVWEKMEESMKAIGAAGGTFKQLLGTWAKNTGYRGSVAQIEGQDVPYGWTIADKLVFSNIKKALGLDKARYLATSAAPISKETLQYFMSLDMRLSEIFGMSECSGPHTLNTPINTRMFSVGRPFNGAEQRLATPGVLTSDPTSITNKEGELCIWGRHIFMGYLHAKEATMGTFEPNGYIRTGDIAKLDDDGYLYITGRIKELIITAGGENVAPVPIEDLIKAELPFLSNVMVVGDKRKFLTALITVKTKPDSDMNPSRDVTDLAISQLQGLGVKVENGITTTDLCNNVEFKKVIDNGIERVNKKAVSAAQRVQKWKLIIDDFSVINGDLTPTMKLKRKVVHDKYIDTIEQLYEDAPTPIKSNL